MKSLLRSLLILLFFVLAAIAYTWPGFEPVWEQRRDQFLSDGTDLTTNPFQFDLLHRGYQRDPSLLLSGAFPNSRLNAPEGFVAWYSPLEKMAGLLFPFFAPVEQTSTLLALFLMVFNGLSFYGMARSFGWNRLLSLALATAWAFSAFTRARAQVHSSLVGIFALPLGIWGLLILQKAKNWKDHGKAALCFLGCALSAHYYLIFLAMFSPFFLLFYFNSVRSGSRALRSLLLAALPALLFLTASFLHPVPAEFQSHVSHVLPSTGQSPIWPHPFLTLFAASPRDYLAGDIAIGEEEWNPLRARINSALRSDPEIGNLHEHAVGIRWVIWFAALLGLLHGFRYRRHFSWRTEEGRLLILFSLMGLAAFLSSLAPDWGLIWGPSAWIHKLVEQIRVPSRIGLFLHFSLLVLVGLLAHSWLQKSQTSRLWQNGLLGFFLVMIFADLPPVWNPLPLAPVVPSREPQISQKPGPCGLGFHFPHVSGTHNSLRFFELLQSLRETDCSVLNPATPGLRDDQLIRLFGYQNKSLLDRIDRKDPELKQQIVQFAHCSQLDWIVFDPRLPPDFIQDVCRMWGGRRLSADLCRSQSETSRVPFGKPDECLARMSH